MMQGREIGDHARRLFGDGVLVVATAGNRASDVTTALMADASVQTLFEGAFEAGPLSTRADILRRESPGWHLLEVKSGFSDSKERSRYTDDLAYTAMVLKRAGVHLVKASLLLLSRDYRYGAGVESMFEAVDMTQEVDHRAQTFQEAADGIARAMLGEQRPDSALVAACKQCDYFAESCLGSKHEHTILELPGLHHTKFKKLAAAGVIGLSELPPDLALNERQARARQAALSGSLVVDTAGLRAALAAVRWPCHYLDFETVATPLPLYEGHGCHRQVLTQFSIHHRDAPGAALGHSAFLADASRCEERELAVAMLEALSGEGAIVTYSSFEKVRLSALGAAFPDLAGDLEGLSDRLVDLCAIVGDHVYHPAFRGSFSIKIVLPALVPGLSYTGLAVADGDTAMARFARMARGEITGSAISETRVALLEYCKLDTLAMVRLHEALLGLSAHP
jgi:hypothetical protein